MTQLFHKCLVSHKHHKIEIWVDSELSKTGQCVTLAGKLWKIESVEDYPATLEQLKHAEVVKK